MMVGGDGEAVDRLRPVLESLAPAPDRGWGHVGPSGSGHFVKMIHNGIEYGMMQAYAEGFDILKQKAVFGLDIHQISEIWRDGSVIRSWLLDLTARALEDDQDLAGIKPWVADSGEGRWTVNEAIDLDVPAPVITLALMMRFASREDDSSCPSPSRRAICFTYCSRWTALFTYCQSSENHSRAIFLRAGALCLLPRRRAGRRFSELARFRFDRDPARYVEVPVALAGLARPNICGARLRHGLWPLPLSTRRFRRLGARARGRRDVQPLHDKGAPPIGSVRRL